MDLKPLRLIAFIVLAAAVAGCAALVKRQPDSVDILGNQVALAELGIKSGGSWPINVRACGDGNQVYALLSNDPRQIEANRGEGAVRFVRLTDSKVDLIVPRLEYKHRFDFELYPSSKAHDFDIVRQASTGRLLVFITYSDLSVHVFDEQGNWTDLCYECPIWAVGRGRGLPSARFGDATHIEYVAETDNGGFDILLSHRTGQYDQPAGVDSWGMINPREIAYSYQRLGPDLKNSRMLLLFSDTFKVPRIPLLSGDDLQQAYSGWGELERSDDGSLIARVIGEGLREYSYRIAPESETAELLGIGELPDDNPIKRLQLSEANRGSVDEG